jgi:parallel beta-helix repeat protein
MRKLALLALLLLLPAVFFSTVLSATISSAEGSTKNWTVDDDSSADFHTIEEAIEAATSGDTILVKSGIYYERIIINKTLALIGENKDSTIIDGNASGTVVETTSNFVSISDFTIQNSGDYPSNLIKLNSEGNRVTNNVLRNSGDRGIEVNFENNTVTDNKVTNTFSGILLLDSSGNNILHNTISFSTDAIMLYDGCADNLVYGNNISNTSIGIFIGPVPAGGSSPISYSNTVSDNNVFMNDKGIMLGGDSSNTTLINNIIRHNGWGIYLQGTRYNLAQGNNIIENNLGIYMEGGCAGTIFSHNNFINNGQQTNSFDSVSWDGGYPSGGNYWSDYKGTDTKTGPNQNITGSDGIGDSPYNKDRYPLMIPFDSIPTPTPRPTPIPTQTPTLTPNQTLTPPPTSVSVSFFTVDSNSTVSALAFNSTSLELSFTVNGTSGTSGYVKVTMAKSLIANVENIKVHLDGNPVNYNVTSNASAWLLTFTYGHSSHQIRISLAASTATMSFTGIMLWIAIGAAPIAIAVIGLLAYSKKRKQ